MKTIIRIGDVIEGPEAKLAKKFSAFGVRAFVEGYGAIRQDHPEAVLFVEKDQSDLPVYVTVGPNPPELLSGDRRVHAVFSPLDSQEPIATFAYEHQARHWAENRLEGERDEYVIRAIDSTDRMGVQASVIVVIRRGEDLLFCRLKKSKMWTFPEARLEVGESVTWAAKRAVKDTVGLRIDDVKIPGLVPYVNTFIEQAAQHFLSCVLVADTFEGEPKIVDPDGVFEHCEWYPARNPPGPLFPTVTGIDRILQVQRPDDLADLTRPPKSTHASAKPELEKPADLVPQHAPDPVSASTSDPVSVSTSDPAPVSTPDTKLETKEIKIDEPAIGRPVAATAQEHVDELTAAMNRPPPVLITGTPRSGTVYTMSVLRAAFAKYATDVGHEEMGAIATVSWCHINPGLDRTYWNEAVGRYTGKYSYACPEWNAIAHQTRDPLKVIASMPTINFAQNSGWDLTHNALRAYRERFHHMGEQDPWWPDDLTSVEAYTLFVIRWNRYIESFTSFRYRVEDLHGGQGSVWPKLLEHLKLEQVPFPPGPFTSNARPHDVLTWDDIKRLAPNYYEPLRDMAHEYGYLD